MSLPIEQFAKELVQDVVATAEADELSTHDAFAERVLGDLDTAGLVDEWFTSYFRAHGVEVSGYGASEAQNTLDIFLVQFRQQPLLAKIGSQELQALAKRALNFLSRVRGGLRETLDESSEAYDMCSVVQEALPKVTSVRVFILTNDFATVRMLPSADSDGVPVSFDIWDLTRLHRLTTSGVLHEPIAVEFREPLPCLSTPKTDENYSVFLAIVRGDVLAGVYRDYGTRLLELNVRSFLQLKGAVNRGIRETLIHSPERFLAYNNGISATASKIEMTQLAEGGQGIRRIHDLQIVNGGQTTASLHSALTRGEGDLSKVFVQVKLTVVQPEHLDEVVPEISKFSNTQNKVTVVDFSSNDPYHVELEKITRTLWAPAVDGSGQETKWYYERARGQYADALNRERTPAKQKTFKVQHPLRQKFLKTDVAKWEHSWAQKPWLVSRGAEKNFRAFMADQSGKPPTSDIDHVQRLLAKGVLFRSAERVVTEQQFGGYRANIVTYSIAKLANATAQRIDLDRIWREQGITDALAEAIAETSHLAYKVIVAPPAGMNHVGEWTKKEQCWARVMEADWRIPAVLEAELVDLAASRNRARTVAKAALSERDSNVIAEAAKVPPETWFDLSHWARETANLTSFQRSLAFSLGRLASRGLEPSIKQATHGLKALADAQQVGFQG